MPPQNNPVRNVTPTWAKYAILVVRENFEGLELRRHFRDDEQTKILVAALDAAPSGRRAIKTAVIETVKNILRTRDAEYEG